MLDLNDIALFVQVVRAGSFAAAARRLGMPANTASRRIQQLEQQLGLRLEATKVPREYLVIDSIERPGPN